MSANYSYRAWDGSQEDSDIDVDALLDLLSDDVLEHGDLAEAIERLLRRGFETPDGDVDGLRDLLEQLRERRHELEELGNPDAQFDQYRDRLAEIEAMERDSLDELAEQAQASGDQRRASVTHDAVGERRLELDLLPDSFADRLSAMNRYEFVSSEAREAFEAMREDLRQEITDTYFQGVTEAMRNPDPEVVARMGEAFDAISTMLEQRAKGEDLDPSFEAFQEKFGDLFPGANSLDELIDLLAERMAAAEAMMNSMSADQRAQLEQLSREMFSDMDLGWRLDRLMANLRAAAPDAGWGEARRFRGDRPMGFGEATDIAKQVGEVSAMEDLLTKGSAAQALGELDLEQIKRHLGPDAAKHLERLKKVTKTLEEAGAISRKGDRVELTAQGVRRLGNQALKEIFEILKKSGTGEHRTSYTGFGHDREESTKAYEAGDPLSLHLTKTLSNALARGGGVPIKLEAQDFEVIETEALTRSATVLCIDLSMSMPMRGNFVPAKKMALALQTLISSRYPRDYFGLVVFSEMARELKVEDLPTVMWDYIPGTNLQHALALSRQMLSKQYGTKQIIVVTDGEPTAHIDAWGTPEFNYPPVPETLRLTMSEVLRCTKAGISITTFALDLENTMFPFVEQIAKVNGGRTFYPSPDNLGGFVLVDFLKHRRTR
jgi:hypothetical protein